MLVRRSTCRISLFTHVGHLSAYEIRAGTKSGNTLKKCGLGPASCDNFDIAEVWENNSASRMILANLA